ncbi:MAG: universal stress protein [Proteobacteria bacterium]|nr:universal stress protein [Pseudomonadota bacterium]MBU1582144.1 universal stress protein [Pseudomonadota bacterium]MBU2456220.1 universal stress protein [Pseudomonadota bacterium]MBU2628641.1 universal stress protein [Pseudomonadota bacterium]
MDRHFLIAVSDQKSALYGIRFVSDFFSDKHHIKSTLFYSAPKPAAVFENEKSLEADSRQKEQQRKLLAKGKEAMKKALQECLDLGFPKENLTEKLEARIFSKIADIIQEGEKGSYDAVVLGRRGLSMIEEIFEDSVSRAIFNETFTFPLWLCRSSDPSRKNVLFYVDGSAASFQMADHVGFIVGFEKKHRVDLLAVDSIAAQSSLMDQYREILLKHGLPADMIQTSLLDSGNPAKQILKIVEMQAYAAVALGRSSSESNILARLFKGPVCSILFKELEDASLWLCP